jgi:hypothetical protein
MKFCVNSTENIIIPAVLENVFNHFGEKDKIPRESEIFSGSPSCQYMELVSDISEIVRVSIVRGG